MTYIGLYVGFIYFLNKQEESDGSIGYVCIYIYRGIRDHCDLRGVMYSEKVRFTIRKVHHIYIPRVLCMVTFMCPQVLLVKQTRVGTLAVTLFTRKKSPVHHNLIYWVKISYTPNVEIILTFCLPSCNRMLVRPPLLSLNHT